MGYNHEIRYRTLLKGIRDGEIEISWTKEENEIGSLKINFRKGKVKAKRLVRRKSLFPIVIITNVEIWR